MIHFQVFRSFFLAIALFRVLVYLLAGSDDVAWHLTATVLG